MKQVLDFIWGQNSGGFIKDQYPGIGSQGFKNLDSLLGANWKSSHPRVGVFDGNAVLGREFPDTLGQHVMAYHVAATAGQGEENILGNSEGGH
jgi:hypothetical protein